MGISGLLPLLKSIHKHTTLKKFAGQTLGIDGYGWLHRGSVACAIELALDKPTAKYIEFAVNRVRMLLDFGITPYVVFDGDALPSKAGTNRERRQRREEAKQLGLSLYKAGKISQAFQELQKAASVTPQMARRLIEELKKMNVQYVVAPYEADAQLAYLEQKGIIDGILSEDSDLLVFGAKRLITKLNQYGECVEIERKDFPMVKEVSLGGWTDAMFRRMAILSGCDYLPNIDKMGLKTAYRYVRKYKATEKVIQMISFEGKLCVPSGYLEKFRDAELTFLHHRVFCPIEQKMVFLTEPDNILQEGDMPFLGPYVDPETVIGVACGELNPKTKQQMELEGPTNRQPALKESRRQTLGTPSELKPKKSIDNFFKSQRTPLQELDPNNLTPSPSQQRLLQRNRNASWEPRVVSSVPQLHRAATSLVSTQSSRSVDRQNFLARASTMSNYKPPKRQRLCSEEDLTPSKEIKHSPFFASGSPALSPLDLKKSKTRKSKKEFDVWSEDSVDDILLGLADVQQVASPQGAIPAVLDISQTTDSNLTHSFDTVPQSSPTQSIENVSLEGDSYTTTKTSQMTSDSCLSAEIEVGTGNLEIPHGPDTSNPQMNISQTFNLQSKETQSNALKRLAATPHAESARSRPDFEVGKLRTQEDGQQRSWTPSRKVFETFVYQSPEQQQNALQSLGGPRSKTEKTELAKTLSRKRQDLFASFQDEDRKVTHPSQQLTGSEDALVPNSEDEVSEAESPPRRPTLNLHGFAFNP